MDDSRQLEGARSSGAAGEPALASPSTPAEADSWSEISSAVTRTILDAVTRRLTEAIAEFDAALDRLAPMHELLPLDWEVARAGRDLAKAQGRLSAEADTRQNRQEDPETTGT